MPEDRTKMAFEALQAMDAAAAIDVIVGGPSRPREVLMPEDRTKMAFEALQAMDAAAAIDVIVGWAKQADKIFELNQALLKHMAASAPKLPPGDELPDDSEGHPG